jgi:hypothetical protein
LISWLTNPILAEDHRTPFAMVLPQGQPKAISEWFPNEIISEIIEAISQRDRATLSRASKLFYANTLPVLYRDVELHGYKDLGGFSSAILSNSVLPELVRSLKVTDW